MRLIKFRGKDAVCNKGWVFGDLVHNQKVTQTGLEPRTMVAGYEVVPESVGQYTGMHDKNDKEIYEGDIISLKEPNRNYSSCEVSMSDKGYWAISWDIHERVILGFVDRSNIEVIGNIYDNPKLKETSQTNKPTKK